MAGRAVLLQPFEPCAAGIGDQAASLDELEQRAGLAPILLRQAIEGLDLRGGLGALRACPAGGGTAPAGPATAPPAGRPPAPGQRERLVDVQPRRVAARRTGAAVDRPGQPAGRRLVHGRPGRVPDRHAVEVRPVRVGVAHALHDRQPLLAPAASRTRSSDRVQPHAIVDLLHLAGRDRQLRPALAVLVVAIRHHGIQPVVAAVELDHDQDAALRGRPVVGQGARGPGQEQRDRRAAGQSADEPRPRRIISRRVGCMGISFAACEMHHPADRSELLKPVGTRGSWPGAGVALRSPSGLPSRPASSASRRASSPSVALEQEIQERPGGAVGGQLVAGRPGERIERASGRSRSGPRRRRRPSWCAPAACRC